MEIPKALRRAIEDAGLSHQGAADACGISRGTITRTLAGEIDLRLGTIGKLKRGLPTFEAHLAKPDDAAVRV